MDVSTSKWLAYILRHGSADHGLWLWPGGWADLHHVAALRGIRCSVYHLLETVDFDREGRFQVLMNGGWWIRATPPEERCFQKWLKSGADQPTWLPPPPPPPPLPTPGLAQDDTPDEDNDDEPKYVPEPHYWSGAW
jgi:hypothetical protein